MAIIFRIYNSTNNKYVQSASKYNINYSKQGYYWRDYTSALVNFMLCKKVDKTSEFIFKREKIHIETEREITTEYDDVINLTFELSRLSRIDDTSIFYDLMLWRDYIHQYDYVIVLPARYFNRSYEIFEIIKDDDYQYYVNSHLILIKDTNNLINLRLSYDDLVIHKIKF